MKIIFYSMSALVVVLLLAGAWFTIDRAPPELLSPRANVSHKKPLEPQNSFVAKENPDALTTVTGNKGRVIEKIEMLPVIPKRTSTTLASAPVNLPELPVVMPLKASPMSMAPTWQGGQNPVLQDDSISEEAMDRFTTETGLTQDEIEQAMNR